MKTILKLSLYMSIIGILFVACNDEETLGNNALQPNEEATFENDQIVLGEKLDNPYSVENMKAALMSLQEQEVGQVSSRSAEINNFKIETTHLYVRFLPKDTADIAILSKDTTLELFEYPLDYEIAIEGQSYQDPEIPQGQPTWQYTAVPIGYNFPNVEYEILEECFIPDEDEDEIVNKSIGIGDCFLADLEDEAFRITGNLDEIEQDTTSNIVARRWRRPSKKHPTGHIRVLNTLTGINDGIRLVKVRTHRIVKISSTYTDTTGYYYIPKSYRHNVHYSVIFENKEGHKIWGNRLFFAPAKFRVGWKSKNGYSRNFDQTSDMWKWATVNNAVCKFRDHCDTYNIPKPTSSLSLWVFDKDQDGVSGSAAMLRRTWGDIGYFPGGGFNTFFIRLCNVNYLPSYLNNTLLKVVAPDITISFSPEDVSTDEVFNKVFHECGHASHWEKVRSPYWINYINYIVTYGSTGSSVYGDGSGKNAGYCGVGEMWGYYIAALFVREEFDMQSRFVFGRSWEDTGDGMTKELLDEMKNWFNPGFLRQVDAINDVTTREIYDCLGATNVDELVEKLKTKTDNDEDIEDAYDFYTNWP